MSDHPSRLRKALQKIHRRNVDADRIYAMLGRHNADDTYTFVVPGRATYRFVTIRQSSGAQTVAVARDDAGVPLSPNLPIELRKENTTFVIVGLARRDDLAYTNPAQDPNIHLHDNRYYRENEFVDSSAGAADAGKPVKLGGDGKLDVTMLDGVDIATLTHAATSKTTPVDADELPLVDSAASNVLKKLTWANLKATLKTYLDTLYFIVGGKSGGQTAYGGTGASENLTLASTAHATKGSTLLLDNTVAIGSANAAINFQILGNDANAKDITYYANGNRRWFFRVSGAETGSDAGSNWTINCFDDANTAFPVFFMERATRYVGIGLVTPGAKLHVLQQTLGNPVQRQQSTSSGSNTIQDFVQGRVTTTNATVTTLFTMAIPASHACLLEVYVVARRTGGASGTAEDCAAYLVRGLFNQVAGAANIVGQNTTVIGESQAAWDVVFDVTGTDARVRVTGAASNSVTWHAHVFHRYLST